MQKVSYAVAKQCIRYFPSLLARLVGSPIVLVLVYCYQVVLLYR